MNIETRHINQYQDCTRCNNTRYQSPAVCVGCVGDEYPCLQCILGTNPNATYTRSQWAIIGLPINPCGCGNPKRCMKCCWESKKCTRSGSGKCGLREKGFWGKCGRCKGRK